MARMHRNRCRHPHRSKPECTDVATGADPFVRQKASPCRSGGSPSGCNALRLPKASDLPGTMERKDISVDQAKSDSKRLALAGPRWSASHRNRAVRNGLQRYVVPVGRRGDRGKQARMQNPDKGCVHGYSRSPGDRRRWASRARSSAAEAP